eukprot:COSAG06_NODE_3065_length_5901_cov_5.700965_4_plen_149_part_01
MEVVDDWRRQVWTATTADPGYWPEGDFRGPYNGPTLNLGARNAGILRPELRDRLRFPFPDETIPADPYPFRPSVGEQLQPILDQLLGPDVSTALAVARPLPATAAEPSPFLVCADLCSGHRREARPRRGHRDGRERLQHAAAPRCPRPR